jgi:hypothetical protein
MNQGAERVGSAPPTGGATGVVSTQCMKLKRPGALLELNFRIAFAKLGNAFSEAISVFVR